MVSIAPVATVVDNCDPNPKVTAVSATASAGTPSDISVSADAVSLRAFRAGTETGGRTYTIDYAATDAAGNRSTASATVAVPHDQR
jgi:hypothetical protein